MEFVVNQAECSIADKRQLYMKGLKPFILKEALFADGTKDYVQVTDEKVTLRFRTGKNNVDEVRLCFGNDEVTMKKTETEGLFVDRSTGEILLSLSDKKVYRLT